MLVGVLTAELENTAPRIRSDYRPDDADLIEEQRRKQKRRERKLKRMILSVGGWLLIAWMVYLMAVTARKIPKLWDPYEILDVSRVWKNLGDSFTLSDLQKF